MGAAGPTHERGAVATATDDKSAAYYRSDRTAFLEFVGASGERVLDVGCGSGVNADWHRGHGARELVGIELVEAAALEAAHVYDRVLTGAVEDTMPTLRGPFDLIVCADVLEHLVDPWKTATALRGLGNHETRLAVSIPNIRFLPAVARIAVGRGFQYEEQGLFDRTHLRFFVRSDVDRLLRQSGWVPVRWGAPPFARLRRVRNALATVTRGRSNDWLAGQLYVIATADPSAAGH